MKLDTIFNHKYSHTSYMLEMSAWFDSFPEKLSNHLKTRPSAPNSYRDFSATTWWIFTELKTDNINNYNKLFS